MIEALMIGAVPVVGSDLGSCFFQSRVAFQRLFEAGKGL